VSEYVYVHCMIESAGGPAINVFDSYEALFANFRDYLEDEPSAVSELIDVCKDAEKWRGRMVHWSDGDYIGYKRMIEDDRVRAAAQDDPRGERDR
jgi:hypothetical protein